MSTYDATTQEQRNARHNLLRRLRALEAATAEQIRNVEAGGAPSLRGINNRWLAVDEATVIHRACQHAVDESVRGVA